MHRATEQRQIGQLRQSVRTYKSLWHGAMDEVDAAQKTLDLWRGIAIVLGFALFISWAI